LRHHSQTSCITTMASGVCLSSLTQSHKEHYTRFIIIIIIIVNICWNCKGYEVNLEVLCSNLGRNIVCYKWGFRAFFFHFLRAYAGTVIKTAISPFHISSSSTLIVLLDTIMLRKYYRLTAQHKAAGLNTLVSLGSEANNRHSNTLQ